LLDGGDLVYTWQTVIGRKVINDSNLKALMAAIKLGGLNARGDSLPTIFHIYDSSSQCYHTSLSPIQCTVTCSLTGHIFYQFTKYTYLLITPKTNKSIAVIK